MIDRSLMYAKPSTQTANRRETKHRPTAPPGALLPETKNFNSTHFGNYHYSASPLQFAVESNASLMPNAYGTSVAPKASAEAKPNDTGLPGNLKSGIENLSGLSLDKVKVHYNSQKPKQLDALAYTQGADIHVAPGQERHLPHEAWHVVQQAQGRVRPTLQTKDGTHVNDDEKLEREADARGKQAAQFDASLKSDFLAPLQSTPTSFQPVVQGMFYEDTEDSNEYIWHWGPVIQSIWKKKLDQDGNQVTYKGYGVWERKHDRNTGAPSSFNSLIQNVGVSILKSAPTMAVGYFLLEFIRSLPVAAAQQLMLPSPDMVYNATNSTALTTVNGTGVVESGGLIIQAIMANATLVAMLANYYVLQRQQQPQLALQVYNPLRDMVDDETWWDDQIQDADSFDETTDDHENPDSTVELSSNPEERTRQIQQLNRHYLKDTLDVIKVYTYARKEQHGRGHQAAAIAVIDQLAREYCGAARIEVVIHADRDAMYVFQNLIRGFDPNLDRQELTINACNFTVIRQGGNSLSPISPFERSLGIYPADDGDLWEESEEDQHFTNIEYNQKIMQSLGAQKLLSLNPHAWRTDYKRFLDTGSQSYEVPYSPSSIYKANTYKDTGQEGMSPLNDIVRNNLLNLAYLVKSKKIDLWVSYGLHYTDADVTYSMKPANEITTAMFFSATEYQRLTRSKKPLIILNLSKQNLTHTKTLRDNEGYVNTVSSNLSVKQINQEISINVSASNSVIFIDIVSGIPKDWFSFIMDYSTLPITYEGANTANLAHQLGKNFMSLRTISTELIEVSGHEEGRSKLEKAGEVLASRFDKSGNYTFVGEVLAELDDPSSAVSKYVAAVLEKANQPESDQLLMALETLRKADKAYKK